MADLEGVINASIESAGISESADATPATSETVDTETPDTTSDETPAEPETPAADAAAPVEGEEPAPAETPAEGTVEPKKKGSLPYHRHEAILKKQRADADAAIAAVRQEYAPLEWARHPDAKATFDAMAIANTDPEAFARGVVSVPELASAFRKVLGAAEAPPAAKPGAAAAPAGSERPQPDVPLEGGGYTYSVEGLEKLLEWQRNQVLEQVDKRYEERFGPIEKDFVATTKWNQALDRTRATLQNARDNWPGFKEHEKAIGDFLRAPGNEKKNLEDAYRAVAVKAIWDQKRADRDAVRAEVLKELNGKPAAASATPRPAVRTAPVGDPRNLEDVINRSLAAAGVA